MFDIDQLRRREEQRLLPARRSWELAKKHLETAIELAEVREREFRQVSDDVKRRLDALDLVTSMAKELEAGSAPERHVPRVESQPMLSPPEPTGGEIEPVCAPVAVAPPAPGPGIPEEDLQQLASSVRRSWRPLFSPHRIETLSILQESRLK